VSEVARRFGIEVLAALPRLQRDPQLLMPERQAACAARLAALEARTVVWLPERESEPAFRAIASRHRVRLLPVVPNMQAYMRDSSEHGVVGAAVARFRRLALPAQVGLALRHASRAPRVAARDFATGLLLLVDMELARLRQLDPTGVLLNPSVTDLVLALDVPALLRDFVRLVERSYGLEAALGTYNYGTLVPRLAAWGIRPGAIAAPFNPRGYLMNPSRSACEATAKGPGPAVVATHLEVDGLVALEGALEYAAGLGIRRAVVDLAVETSAALPSDLSE
jgi:hypothetical protein